MQSENGHAVFIKSASFARAFDSPPQRPWAALLGYRKQVSPELVFVYRGLLKSPIRFLALLLLMLRVLADNHDLALAADDLALLADRLNRWSYLHDILPPSKILVGWDTGKPATAGARVTYAPPPAFGSLGTPSDTTAGQVVGRHLNGDLVAGKNADKVHAELA